jgi:Tfp pilus assembly protein PilN
MININLLSEAVPPSENKAPPARSPFSQRYQGILVILLISIAALHGIAVTVQIVQGSRIRLLKAYRQRLEPQRKDLDAVKLQNKVLADLKNSLEGINQQKTRWSHILNALSRHLPYGIWFNNAVYKEKLLELKCSVVVLQKNEMNVINAYLDALKKDRPFMERVEKLEVGAIQRKLIGSYEVVDFVFSIFIKE